MYCCTFGKIKNCFTVSSSFFSEKYLNKDEYMHYSNKYIKYSHVHIYIYNIIIYIHIYLTKDVYE